jgi:hypothetical protein
VKTTRFIAGLPFALIGGLIAYAGTMIAKLGYSIAGGPEGAFDPLGLFDNEPQPAPERHEPG